MSKRLHVNKTLSLNNDIKFKKLDTTTLMKNRMIKEAFLMFDTNESGDIDKYEFKNLIVTLGLEINDKKILDIMRVIDKDHSGSIDLTEFTEMMKKYHFHSESPVEQHISSTFNLYDKDSDGYISVYDIRKVAEELEENFTLEEAELFVGMCKYLADVNGMRKGIELNYITQEEFCNFLFSINFLEEVKNEDIKDLTNDEAKDIKQKLVNQSSNKSSFINATYNNSEQMNLNPLNNSIIRNLKKYNSKKTNDENDKL